MHFFEYTDQQASELWEEIYYLLDEVAFSDDEHEAEERMNEILEECIHPDKYLILARFREYLNEYEAAFEALTKYIETKPGPLGYYLRSDMYRNTDDPEPAQISDLTKAIDLSDEDFSRKYLHQALLIRARLFKSLGEYAKGHADCDRILSLPPRYDKNFTKDEADLMKAELFRAEGKLVDAEKSFDNAIDSAPEGLNRHLPLIEKARFLSDQKRFDEAIILYEKIIKDPELEIWEKNLYKTHIAECQLDASRIDQARETLSGVLLLDPDFTPALELFEKCKNRG
jgi:tetratricopeptide (TPR) repeat protein